MRWSYSKQSLFTKPPHTDYVRLFFSERKKMEFDALINEYKETETTKKPKWTWFKTRPIRPTMRPHDDEMIV